MNIASERVFKEKTLNDLRFHHTRGYFDKSFALRVCIGLFFAVFLFLFLHFRQTYVETLELGSQAQRYVVAQVDFAFPDVEATILAKQEAGQSIGAIYRIDRDALYLAMSEFQKHIAQDPATNLQWSEMVEATNFKDLPHALNLLSVTLSQSRFTDAKTLQTIESMPQTELPHPSQFFFIFLPSQDTLDGKPPIQFWHQLSKQIYIEEEIPPQIVEFILNYFGNLEWKFDADHVIEYTLRKITQAKVADRYTHVMAGERIIDQGEKVTARHIAMLTAMKEKLDERRNLFTPSQMAGSALMTLLFLFIAVYYLKENHAEVFYSNKNLALLAAIVLLNLLLAKMTEVFFLKGNTNLLDLIHFPLFVPFAAILINCLINRRVAAFATLFLSVIFTLIIPVQSVPFLVINIVASTVAILSMRKIRKRKEVFVICGKAWLAGVLVIVAFNLYDSQEVTKSILTEMSSTFIFMGLTSIIVVGLLPILESIFRIMTDITLMEFMDPNNEYLRKLMTETPGTFQHSLVVGSLSESAALSIGANGLFCRAATAYHDIGKLHNAQYFTENQLTGIDMHLLLTPKESAQVIISHVSAGVAIARKMGLPEPFIDIIKEHHGTTLVYYFYHKQIEMMGGDKSKVDEKEFRYSGPRPRTKESTIIMIADSLEAASRSLDSFTEEAVRELLDNLVAQKNADGQFDESPLTFEELTVVKNTLVKNLLAANHPRIKYPPHHPGEEG